MNDDITKETVIKATWDLLVKLEPEPKQGEKSFAHDANKEITQTDVLVNGTLTKTT